MTTDTAQASHIRKILGQDYGPTGRRLFSTEGRMAAATFAWEALQNQVPISVTARVLGLHPTTLAKWVHKHETTRSPAFLPIVRKALPAISSGDELFLVEHPSGIHVRGLSIPQIADLIKALS